MKLGNVESPWVNVKHWRCEPAFFAYFLCGGKESECRPAQGQRLRREAHTRMPAKGKANDRLADGSGTLKQPRICGCRQQAKQKPKTSRRYTRITLSNVIGKSRTRTPVA
ncbi:hypothetical protein SAMN05192539_101534 [Paraburkholderia diazotrophica]|uniref:Uncharacterized protein n=1 Tax=Paraburkholderia diazotrophica TaxID=667676 RepID=A0A1H7AWZ6_9BURK|nr:hypothetical protein SAMN05192539_101534 [Paraburkholderia diazotrophica]